MPLSIASIHVACTANQPTQFLPMLRALKQFFDRHIAADVQSGTQSDRQAHTPDHSLRLAAAALLVEVAHIDRDANPQEYNIALRAVRDKFGLSQTEAEELLQLAEAEVTQANDYYQFTSLINRHFSQEQKQHIIELMWQIAYADEELSAHELHLMRKIAGLLHIPDSAYIAAKMRARDATKRNRF